MRVKVYAMSSVHIPLITDLIANNLFWLASDMEVNFPAWRLSVFFFSSVTFWRWASKQPIHVSMFHLPLPLWRMFQICFHEVINLMLWWYSYHYFSSQSTTISVQLLKTDLYLINYIYVVGWTELSWNLDFGLFKWSAAIFME